MTTNNHPAHGPVSLDRLHQISEILSKASAQSDGGNLGNAMADAVKVIDGAIAAFGAEPVAWTERCEITNMQATGLYLRGFPDNSQGRDIALYTAPPAPVVPDELTREEYRRRFMMEDNFDDTYRGGWNACRAAMLQGADGKPELTVWYGSMPETNGKTNWTAMLHRKGQHPWEGITIDCSEYPDRVRYEADRMRHLIGELVDEPDILAYDADAHSGYVNPGNSPVTPDAYEIKSFGFFRANEGSDGLALHIEQFHFESGSIPKTRNEGMVPKFALQAIINRLQEECDSMECDPLIDILSPSAAPQQEVKSALEHGMQRYAGAMQKLSEGDK
ncbi:hypothetical protein [Citrobacter portucalensis]|uniref:hypothetical protein n=1 Tax=Citrobacter portucalensis TaxID=1639133 RepID=UPI002B3ADFA7|nr:hypothetical protein [Citrobacter portucalensis]MEB2739449.1 hypothetical protein [Citrobacter portucalensis]